VQEGETANAPQAVGGSGKDTPGFVEMDERGPPAARKDRRKQGVNTEKRGWNSKNKSKILLTQNGHSKDTPDAPVTAFPENVPAFLPYPHAGKTVNKEYRCRHNWKKKL
jgi:hypothetical protein